MTNILNQRQIVCSALLLLMVVTILPAQSGGTYEVTQSVIANGGGRSADATYAVEGTIGQHAAGSVSSNAPFSFQAGFWQSFLAPTAATVSISGRVITANGNPVRGSRVILTSLRGDFAKTALTSSFGYYRLEGIEVGQSYLLEVVSKGSQFEPRIVSVLDEITDFDLVVFQ
jgi:hypothetical protein